MTLFKRCSPESDPSLLNSLVQVARADEPEGDRPSYQGSALCFISSFIHAVYNSCSRRHLIVRYTPLDVLVYETFPFEISKRKKYASYFQVKYC